MNEISYYRNTEEYTLLVEQCNEIKKGRRENVKRELLLMYAEIAERIVSDPLYERYKKGNGDFLETCFDDIGIGRSSGHAAIQWYTKHLLKSSINPDNELSDQLDDFMAAHPEISGWKDVTKFLPSGKLETHTCTRFERVCTEKCIDCHRAK